jgi:hypothetical protein
MKKEYTEADHTFHYGWASNGDFGQTVIKELAGGKDHTDAPILLDQWWVTQRLSHLEGKILTLVEATCPKENQKATKDIVRDYIGTLYAEVVNTTHTEDYTQHMCDISNTK